jgi:hypothetical protein
MWLDEVRNLIEKNSSITAIDIQTMNDVNDFLIKYPPYDAIVSAIMKNTDYLYFHDYDTKVNPYRYNKRLFQEIMEKQPDALAFIEDHLDMESGMFYKYSQNLEGYIQYNRQLKLFFFTLHIELYVNLIRHLYNRLNVYIAACESLGEDKIAQDLKKLTPIVLNAISTGKKALVSTN